MSEDFELVDDEFDLLRKKVACRKFLDEYDQLGEIKKRAYYKLTIEYKTSA
ncbi:hypothetical protein Pan241w_14780 [Gimesia alba]|uniref:Uncharacterized protein n=1 Tax=Gimesia alba TaxID=2527973 RepID=A0A517RBZ6_9PLAN|nr:hypothetical protein [Gimesia alba]QDT41417.1 hypothetical protein Pan241w_14780 [Gimesia alba]